MSIISDRPTALCYFKSQEFACQFEPALSSNGFTILRARHGMHAYWLATTGNPDIIIIEGNQEDGNDYVLDRIRSHEKCGRVPVIVLSDQPEMAAANVMTVQSHIAPTALASRARGTVQEHREVQRDCIDAVFSEINENDAAMSRVVRSDSPSERLERNTRSDVNRWMRKRKQRTANRK